MSGHYQFSMINFVESMMNIKKRKEIKFKLEAYWIDSNRRSWLFYIFCVISSLSSLSINGKNDHKSVNQYLKEHGKSHDDDENVYSAIIKFVFGKQRVVTNIKNEA